jgi:hypothetical protein
MSKPFFLLSKHGAYAGRVCDQCGAGLSQKPGEHYYNPSPRAKVKNICPECFEIRETKKAEFIERWKESQGISQADSHMRDMRREIDRSDLAA